MRGIGDGGVGEGACSTMRTLMCTVQTSMKNLSPRTHMNCMYFTSTAKCALPNQFVLACSGNACTVATQAEEQLWDIFCDRLSETSKGISIQGLSSTKPEGLGFWLVLELLGQ